MTETVALFGASGAVGHALVPELDRRGVTYRVVGRDTARMVREFPRAQTMRADFLSGDGLAEAAQGVGTIFYLAGAPYTEFQQHPIMTHNALDAAQAAGVQRFIHVAPVYSYGLPLTRPVPESQPHVPNTRKGHFRFEQEQEVFARHGDALATMIVHLPDFYGPYAEFSYANVFIREALSGKTASFIGPLDAQREFVFVPDVADPLLRLAELGDAYGRCWNLGGQAIAARAFADAVFDAIGKPPKYRSIPKFVLQGIGLVQPFMREVAEMYYLFDSDFVLDDTALQQRLGSYEKTPITRGLAQTVAQMTASPAR
ncbi:MAG TPA: NAD-dependent epimerase/dehydratase family protein [Candidatus Cybelea sp.]|nr:NAD-dependent epimerase/dehydratase family protein [Candidatus Cybelea sp.]